MKLSEAIRLGSTVIKANQFKWLEENSDGEPCGCACGAALYAAGVTPAEVSLGLVSVLLAEKWPWTAKYAWWAGCNASADLLTRITVAFNQDGFDGAARLVESLEREFVPAQKEEVCEQQLSA